MYIFAIICVIYLFLSLIVYFTLLNYVRCFIRILITYRYLGTYRLLNGLSHQIFALLFWHVLLSQAWNRYLPTYLYWVFYFSVASSIVYSHFKFMKRFKQGAESAEYIYLFIYSDNSEPLPTFVNLPRRFQESPRCFGTKSLKTFKWLPPIERATEKLKNQ